MKKVRTVIIGFGDRGHIYGNYALEAPDREQVVAVVDPSSERLALAKKEHHLDDARLFSDVDAFLASDTECDFIVNATMDQQHYDILKKILPLGKYVLTEKPIVNNKEKLLELYDLSVKSGSTVFVGHVLRYTPFYKTIKKWILDGKIGEITSLELSEHVAWAHYSGSYARGRWRSEKECGSTFLLAKSCHDTDLLCWLNNGTRPVSVSSFGGRYYYIPENAPKGSTDWCYDCPCEKDCLYSSVWMYEKCDWSPEVTHPLYHKASITPEDRHEFVRKSLFGRCIYKIEGNDLVDRQVTSVIYENGSVASFMLTAGSTLPNRTIFINGTLGEIEGNIENGDLTLRENIIQGDPLITHVNVNQEIRDKVGLKGHSGGDYEISKSIIDYINGDHSSFSLTTFRDSVNSHLLVYAADESRIAKKIVDIEKL